MEREFLLVVFSERRTETSLFPTSCSFLGRSLLNYKDKGSRDFSGYRSWCVLWLQEEEEEEREGWWCGGLIIKKILQMW